MKQQEITAIGTADNVDLSERDPITPLEKNVDERRVVSCYCCTCEESETILAEVGRNRKWEHDANNPTHVVEYHREDEGGRR